MRFSQKPRNLDTYDIHSFLYASLHVFWKGKVYQVIINFVDLHDQQRLFFFLNLGEKTSPDREM